MALGSRSSRFPLLLALAGACVQETPDPFALEVVTPPDIVPLTTEYVASYFKFGFCDELALRAGVPDLVWTSTPSERRRAETTEGLGEFDFSKLPGEAALDVRAVDAEGTPLAARCIPVTRFFEAGRLRLFPLAPVPATLEILEPTALRAGSVSRPIRVKVSDGDGEPVAGVFVSPGVGLPLSRTDADGLASIATPTTAAPYDAALAIDAYGIPGPPHSGRATVMPPAPCPEATFSTPLATGSASLSFLAGDEDVVVVLRPERPGVSLVEVFRPPGSRPSLERVVTATTAGLGPLAVGRDQRDGRFTIAVGAEDGLIHLLRFDGAFRTIERSGTITVRAFGAGALPRLDALHLVTLTSTGGPALIVVGQRLQPTVLHFPAAADPGSFEAPLPLLDVDRPAPRGLHFGDLIGDDTTDLLVVGGEGLTIWQQQADGSYHDNGVGGVANVTGAVELMSFDVRVDDRTDVVVLDEPPGQPPLVKIYASTGDGLTLRSSEAVDQSVERVFVDDLNRDGLPDVLALSRRARTHSVLVGDGHGLMLPLAKCDDLVETSGGYAIDMDRDGVREWVTFQRDARELTVLSLPAR